MDLSGWWHRTRKGLNSAKDLALSSAAARLINHYRLNLLGKMTSFHIDSARQEILVTLDLHGEDKPIDLTLGYRLFEENGDSMIEITRVEASRTWITALINDLIPAHKKRQPLPPLVKAALTSLIK